MKNIVDLIRNSNLIYMKLDSLCKAVSVLENIDLQECKNQIMDLIHNGILFIDDDKKVSICADKG